MGRGSVTHIHAASERFHTNWTSSSYNNLVHLIIDHIEDAIDG